MTAKQYLTQIRILTTKALQINDEIRTLESGMLGRAINYDGVNVQTSKVNDVMADYMERRENIIERLSNTLAVLNDKRETIVSEIHALEDDRYIQILYKRYVELKRWELIALEMNYNYTYVVELHGDALNAFINKHPNISELQ